MKLGRMSREDAIKYAGLENVLKVEGEECDFTNRVMPEGSGLEEFAASIQFIDAEGTERTLRAYYYQDAEVVRECEDLSILTWEPAEYEIW